MTTTTRTAVISQPMKGVSPEQVARSRARAEQELAARGYVPHDTVYETAFSYEAPQGVVHPAAWHAGAAIQRLAAADALYLAEGWQTARGCRIEHAVAQAYDIPIIHASTKHPEEES